MKTNVYLLRSKICVIDSCEDKYLYIVVRGVCDELQ